MTHTIYVRKHTMSDNRLAVGCSCGELYEDPEYTLIGGNTLGVSLSVLMDIAEAHQDAMEYGK